MKLRELLRGAPAARCCLCMSLACFVFGAPCLQVTAQEIIRFPAKGQVPPGYPAQYAAIIAAAEQEGQLVIHSTTDIGIAAPLIDDFQTLYPRIEVRYQDMNSNDLHNVYLGDLLASPTTADVLWSSAMDLQLRLASAGQAQAYDSPEIAGLPPWALWKNLAFGTTFEPIVVIYNKRLLAADEIPQTHADLARLLTEKRDRFFGKVATYNIERSALGFLLATQDERASGEYWPLIRALGSVGTHLVPTTEAILTRVGKGEDLLGYNALGSYAYIESKRDSSVGYVYPRDYTLVITRIMLIGKKAANPNAARLWVDYLLSRRGQTVLADGANLPSLRGDVAGANSAAALTNALGQSLRPIPLGPDLLATFSDQTKRLAFLRQWQQAIAMKP
ncbi:MAG TPA: ABC transporter substrate-binding protein [Casimicrobiaceae bacterium]|nr:ABC transporter substrate-binding protein [Casimicrobiaceae bacterium]